MKNLTKTALLIALVVFVATALFFANLTETENMLLPYLGEIILSMTCTVGVGLAIGELVHRHIHGIEQ